jgi:probable selenate reductase FAD-binding subunit
MFEDNFMLNIHEYHRPDQLETALALLSRPGVRTVALAGGTQLIGSPAAEVEAVVDLQDLGLDYIRADADTLRLGAMTRLQELIDSPLVQALAGGLVSRTAHSTTSSILRHQATLGGTLIAAAGRADLVPVLLALDAEVVICTPGERHLNLYEFCRAPQAALAGGLLIEVRIRIPLVTTGAAYHKIGRTPGDQAIVGVAARLTASDGRCSQARLAACGVGPMPIRLTDAEALLEDQTIEDAIITAAAEAAWATVAPISDFRASADYRREMVAVLVTRAVRDAWQNIA